jgi:hypothetical protein
LFSFELSTESFEIFFICKNKYNFFPVKDLFLIVFLMNY